jgi:hypothetical protein
MSYNGLDTVAYGNKLVGWAKNAGIANEELVSYFISPKVDAETKYMFAKVFRETERAKRRPAEAGHENHAMYLVPYTQPDGSFYYVNRNTGKVVASMMKQSNGLFSYMGDERWMEILGGRGKLSGIITAMNDDDYFHDKQGGSKK